MIKIKQLRLKNFKSFREANIPISNGFTVIVGANGTGKSNILDALMFVLGITSMKALRASKMIDLVNKASVENYAKVELQLKGTNKNFEVTRIIDKQGRSVYKLNDQKVTLNETVSLLGELGLKATGHNIVAQGDVTRIIEMSPIERREIIDEIAGLREFDEKKAEALNELEKVEEKIKEASIVLNERGNYLDDLEKDRNAAREYEQLSNEKKMSKGTLIYGEIEKIREKQETNQRKISSLKEEISLKETEKNNFKEQELKNRVKINELSEKILSSNERAYTEIGREIEETKSAASLAGERTRVKGEQIKKNSSRQDSLKERTKLQLQEKNSTLKKISEAENALPKLKSGLEAVKSSLEALVKEKESAEMKVLEDETRKINAELEKEQRIFYEKNSLIPHIEISNKEKTRLIEDISRERETLSRKISDLEKKQQLLSVIKMKHPSLEEEIAKARKSYENILSEMKVQEAEIKINRNAAEELAKEISKCPVCERPLEKNMKKELLKEKEKMLRAAQSGYNAAEKKMGEAMLKIRELDDAAEKSRQLSLEVSQFPEIKDGLKSKDERMRALKDSIDGGRLDKEKENCEKLKENVSRLEKEFKSKNAELEKLKNERARSRYEMERKKGAIENEISALEERKESVFSKNAERTDFEIESIKAETEQLQEENSKLEKEIAEEKTGLKELAEKSKKLDAELKKAQEANKGLIDEKNSIEQRNDAISEKIIRAEQQVKKLEYQSNEMNIENSKHEVRLLDLEEEFNEYRGVKRFEKFIPEELKKRITEIEKRITELGAINMKALGSFDELKKEVDELKEKATKLDSERISVLEMIQKIEVKRTNVFLDCFNNINKNFGNMFLTLFGGEGRLKLSDPNEPLEAGLLIEAKHKSTLQNIDSMSGGEKALTALAFLFAIQLYEPAPFYIFDEADAALDAENSVKLASMIKEISSSSQFIAITHNDQLIKEADQIIGVALNEQKSSVIGLRLKEELAQNKGAA